MPASSSDPLTRTVAEPALVPAGRPEGSTRRRLRAAREWVSRYRHLDVVYRVCVGIVGGLMVIGGLILVPLPGPGWLVVFLGFAVLGTEFHWAHRVSQTVKRLLDRFWTWWRARRARKAAAAEARSKTQTA